MSSLAPTQPSRPTTRESLLRRRRGWFFGLTGDKLAKSVFQGNAAVSIIILGLITFTIFKDAATFIPQNRSNLEIYRLAGLEYTDYLRTAVKDYSSIGRFLNTLRSEQMARFTSQGLTSAEATERLKEFDAYAARVVDAAIPLDDLLFSLTDIATSLKERQKIAQDMAEARGHLLEALPRSTPEQAAELKAQLENMVVERIDFRTEVKPLLETLPQVQAASQAFAKQADALTIALPQLPDAALQQRLNKVPALLVTAEKNFARAVEKMTEWDQTKPVAWWESFTAFLFGRQWLTASFWQDWYGVLPLFFGSALISLIALVIAIPLGVAAAIYVNQVATSFEQKFIKPCIEFIAAIPSVVLGFFGIAMLGETLRRVSQVPWLDWVPGFPMSERLNASTAACLLALMAIPTIFSLAEDAINNVPRSFKEAALALGSTRLQTIIHIVVPAALSGIMAAILLGLGRVIGETMVVLLCAGNRIEIPDVSAGLGVAFQPVHTMTGIIAQEMGEVVRGSIHYRALFMVGALLFMISLLINWLAQKIVRRYRITAS